MKSVGCTYMLIGTEFVVQMWTTEQYTVHAFRSSQPHIVILPVVSWINPVNGPACMSGCKTRRNYESSTKDQFVVNKILIVTLGSLHWSIHWCLAESFQIRAKRSCLFAASTRIRHTLIFMYFVCTLAQAHSYTWGVDKNHQLYLPWRCKGLQS